MRSNHPTKYDWLAPKRDHWRIAKSMVLIIGLIVFIWITVTDDIRVRISVTSKDEELTADHIAHHVAQCIVSVMGAEAIDDD